MNDIKPILQKIYRDESGQMLPWIVMLMVLFIGMAGLTLDLGHAYICYRELQASTDAAALAGAYAMTLPTATVANVTTAVQNANSQGPGGANMNINLPQAAVTPHFACVPYVTTTFGVPCTAGVMGDNAIQVTQTAVIPTMFIRILSLWGINSASSINLTTVATAALKGAAPAQYNVAMVVDSTNSMGQNDTDVNCGDTRIHCALQGVQTMLGLLAPCATGPTRRGLYPITIK